MSARSPLEASPERCIDHSGRLSALEEARRRQNGSLDKLGDAVRAQGELVGRVDEKLSMLIVHRAEDRAEVVSLRNEVVTLRTHLETQLSALLAENRTPREPAPVERPAPDTKLGLVRTVITRYPLGAGILLGLILATFLVLGSDFLRGTIRSAIPHSAPAIPAPTQAGR